MINDAGEDGMDKDDEDLFIKHLINAATLLSDIQNRQSETRRAWIIPRFIKEFQPTLRKTVPDTYLFGKDLPMKMKESRERVKSYLKQL